MNTISTRIRLLSSVILSAFLLVSCAYITNTAYYAHLIRGEALILSSRKPIQELLTDKNTPEELRARLRSILEMREFARNELKLPETESYTAYVDLKRPYAEWALTAAPEFSTSPKVWCFPVGGCTSYLTFFDKEYAARYEKDLQRKGYEVSVRGVTSFSTAGWFADPAFNTLFQLRDYEYAGIVFHEIAHEKLHVKNDTAFSESFATFVGHIGQYRWIQKHYGQEMADKFMKRQNQATEFSLLVSKTRKELESLYLEKIPIEEMRKKKESVFAGMRAEYERLRVKWGDGPYDYWFQTPGTNALLLSEEEYTKMIPMFQKLYDGCSGNLDCFYAKADTLTKLPAPVRAQRINDILNG